MAHGIGYQKIIVKKLSRKHPETWTCMAPGLVVMVMSGIAGMFEYGSFGKFVFSFVKTDLN